MHLDLREIFAAFMVLFAIIDIPGSIPIIMISNQNPVMSIQWGWLLSLSWYFLHFCLLELPCWAFRSRYLLFCHCRFIHHLPYCNGNDSGVELFKQDSQGSGSVFLLRSPWLPEPAQLPPSFHWKLNIRQLIYLLPCLQYGGDISRPEPDLFFWKDTR